MQTKQRKILATFALTYANAPLHLGHLLGCIQADIWVRFQKMRGVDCLFISGSDSHGTPIMIQAQKKGTTPEALVAEISQEHQRDFADFHIAFDNYHTTHSIENKLLSEDIFLKHEKQGHIEQRDIEQAYDPEKNMFLPDRFVKGECPRCHVQDQYGDNCEACGATYAPLDLINPYSTLSGAKPITKTSTHYFFNLPLFTDTLKAWLNAGHLQIEMRNKLQEWFDAGLQTWDISRDAPYFGFEIPGKPDKYFYCWLDAPIGYMASFKNLCDKRNDVDFNSYWQKESDTELYHFIGKDIVYFHALFWPALLSGANYRMPTALITNGFLTIEGQKMSKSRGTFILARTYLTHLPAEALRYYFAAKLSENVEDLDLNWTDFIQRINADVIGKFVNIASRCASFIHKYFDGQLAATLPDPLLFETFQTTGDDIAAHFERIAFSQAIKQIMQLADRANQYIDEKKPWAMIKEENQRLAVQGVCTQGLNLFRLLAIYLKPILPNMAEKIEKLFNIAPLTWEQKNVPLLNMKINPFEPLAHRLEAKQIDALLTAEK